MKAGGVEPMWQTRRNVVPGNNHMKWQFPITSLALAVPQFTQENEGL